MTISQNLFQVSGSMLTSNNCGSASLVDPVTPNFLLNFRFFLDIPFVITSPSSVQPFQLDSQAKVSFHNFWENKLIGANFFNVFIRRKHTK